MAAGLTRVLKQAPIGSLQWVLAVDGTEPTCEEMLINRSEVTTQSDNAVTGTAGDDIVSVWLGGDHETITFLVTRDGAAVLEADITPRYRGVEINGEGCGECPMATHTLSE